VPKFETSESRSEIPGSLNFGPGDERKDRLIVCENKYYIGRRKGGIPYKQ
jgi:hypothetical protein